MVNLSPAAVRALAQYVADTTDDLDNFVYLLTRVGLRVDLVPWLPAELYAAVLEHRRLADRIVEPEHYGYEPPYRFGRDAMVQTLTDTYDAEAECLASLLIEAAETPTASAHG